MTDLSNLTSTQLTDLGDAIDKAREERAERERREQRIAAHNAKVTAQRARLQPRADELRAAVKRLEPVEAELVAKLEKVEVNSDLYDDLGEALGCLRHGVPVVQGATADGFGRVVGWSRIPQVPPLLRDHLPDQDWSKFEGLEHARERLEELERRLGELAA